ncbi:MAG TPA: Cys-tRNA(Pro) deacylase [Longimicrobiales bacterium]|nr:Cys-tRNA(Pro) deacylase [Longimicrobiales bacterium]
MTPAVLAARRARVEFRIHEYEHDPAAESYGLEAALKLGVAPERVFKTLVANVDADLVVAIVPVACTLDLKALASATNGKRAAMAEMRAAERATGYVAGGISPLGQKKRLRTVLDESALQHETVFVSAGRRGLELELSPHDLSRLTSAVIAPIAR